MFVLILFGEATTPMMMNMLTKPLRLQPAIENIFIFLYSVALNIFQSDWFFCAITFQCIIPYFTQCLILIFREITVCLSLSSRHPKWVLVLFLIQKYGVLPLNVLSPVIQWSTAHPWMSAASHCWRGMLAGQCWQSCRPSPSWRIHPSQSGPRRALESRFC